MKRQPLSNGDKRAPGCLVLFMLPFLGFGLLALGFAGKVVLDHVRVASEFVETACVIVGKRLVENRDSDGSTYRPEFTFRFNAGGETVEATGYSIAGFISTSDRRGSERALARFVVGEEYPCWYDPRNPSRAVLTRAFPTFVFAMSLLFGAVFSVIGGAVLFGALRSRSSRVSGSQALRSGNLRLPLPPIPKAMPPAGVMREIRPETGFAARAVGFLLFAILWNGIVSVFVVVMVREWIGGRRPWVMTLFLVPFVAIGLLVVWGAAHQFLVAGAYRRLAMRTDRQVVHPGERLRIAVRHPGEYMISRWAASLVCREKVRYTRGTDTRHEDRVVYEEAVDEASGISVSPSRPLQREFGATVPAGAMHSFDAENNKIVWSIRLKAVVPGRPDLDVEYPVIVIPPGLENTA